MRRIMDRWAYERSSLILCFVSIAGVAAIIAVIVALAYFLSSGTSMYIDGYVPQESGEVVQCVYTKHTHVAYAGKSPIITYSKHLNCQPVIK